MSMLAASTGVTYFDKAITIRRSSKKAKCVVLSANGTETPRLLLLSSPTASSKACQFSGIVGKYLMTGMRRPLQASSPIANEYKGAVTGAAVLSYVPNDVKARGFYGGGRMTARGQMSPCNMGSAARWRAKLGHRLQESVDRAGQPPADDGELHFSAAVETNTVDLDRR